MEYLQVWIFPVVFLRQEGVRTCKVNVLQGQHGFLGREAPW